jgi:hypothetical protein
MGRRVGLILAGIVIALGLAGGAGALLLSSPWASERVEREAIAFIEARFDARAEIGEISLRLFPRVAVSGDGLTLTRHEEAEPFLTLQRFEIAGSPLALLRRRVEQIELDGFELRVMRGRPRSKPVMPPARDVRVDRIHVMHGRLLIVPNNPEKLPLDFDLHDVTLRDFGFDRSAEYSALITNPKPEAVIQSEGRIGPWDTLALRSTPLQGIYLLKDGTMNTIKGLGGVLTSSGSFEGILERINVQGSTSIPDFQLTLARQAVPLETKYSATVDGTTGDTYLHDVEARLGRSVIHAKGAVESKRGVKGRTITLDVTAKGARFEDLLRLSIKGPPSMRGALDLQTAFVLPPGERDVPQRLALRGTFAIRGGRFTSDTVQDKLDELSRRGRGEPDNQEVSNVVSNFGGRFALADGVVRLPSVQFAVQGANVDLNGDYQLETESLNFAGALLLDAPLSRTVKGFKSFLLKAIDPLFRTKGAGTRIPIRIQGTIDQPSFKVDVRRVLTRG